MAKTKTVTIKGFITHRTNSWDKTNLGIGFSMHRPSAEYSPNTVVIREHSFDVEIPADFDPRPAMIESLKAQEKKAMADFELMVGKIRKQISQLQAIELSVEAA